MKPFTFDELVRIEDALVRRIAEASMVLETLEGLRATPAESLTHWRREVEEGRLAHWRREVEEGRALVAKVRAMWIEAGR